MARFHRAISRALVIVLIAFIMVPFGPLLADESAAPGQPAVQTIRVGLAWGKSVLTVVANGGFSILDEASGQTVVQSATAMAFAGSPGGITVDGYGRCVGPLTITAAPAAENYLAFGDRRYRGTFQIVNDNSGQLTLVNVLPLEEYLFGVVPREIGSTWPIEAQKAQAVAARTFALSSTGHYGSYDVRNTTDSQVYGGLNDEKPLSTQAVLDTAGQVATYGGQLISTPFYSSSGGYTESNENVWTAGTPLPYERAVPDPYDSAGPWNAWHRELTLEQIGQSLVSGGYDVGQLYEVIPQNQVTSGRWVWVTVRGSKGSKRISSNAFRIAVGTYTLPSTKFSMVARDAGLAEVQQSYDATATPTVIGANGQTTTASLNGLTVVGSAGTAVLGASGEATWTVTGKQMLPAALVFDGSGWGHGVGMSQWGAYGMAQQGYNYQDILKHYYTGIELVNLSASAPATTNGPQQ